MQLQLAERTRSIYSGFQRGIPALGGEAHPLSALMCLIGVFMHLMISDPLLNAMGMRYAGEEGNFYEKIHPGTLFIFISFVMLICAKGNPLQQILLLAREQSISFALLAICAISFVYMVARSGPSGLAFMFDTHMTVAICAMVLCYTPLSWCRVVTLLLVTFAVINSAIGVIESIGRFRIFTYDSDWVGMTGKYFRASAIRGHPLANTMLSMIAIFVMLGMRYHVILKIAAAGIILASMVAFGGRAGLITTLALLLIHGVVCFVRKTREGEMNLSQLFLTIAMGMLVPAIIAVGLYLLIHSSIGERLAAGMVWDNSAQARWTALGALGEMRPEEVLLGISTDRILDIAHRTSLTVPASDLENPWLLMFMNMGGVMFTIWLGITVLFIRNLLRSGFFVFQLAAISYFLVSSTFNSFGRKDSTYLIMVSMVICAVRAMLPYKQQACETAAGELYNRPTLSALS